MIYKDENFNENHDYMICYSKRLLDVFVGIEG